MGLRQRFDSYLLGQKMKYGLAQRGRTSTEPSDGGPTMPAKFKGIVTIEAKVFRAATGEWEDLGVISQGPIEVEQSYLDGLAGAANEEK